MEDPSEQRESNKARYDLQSMRVAREAQDVFWGVFSGSTRRLFFRVLGHSACIFIAALAVFFLFALDNVFEICHSAPRKGFFDICHELSMETLLPFLPSLCMFAAGSFISTKLCSDRIFQTSAFNTVINIFMTGIALSSFGISGALHASVLAGVFLFMYAGYRCAFFRNFRGNLK